MKPHRTASRSDSQPGRFALVAALAVIAIALSLAATRTFAGDFSHASDQLGIHSRVQFEPVGANLEDPPADPRTKPIGEVQLYGGVYMPSNTSQSSGALGARFAAFMVPQLSMGLSADWFFNSNSSLGAPGPTLPASVFAPRAVLGDASAATRAKRPGCESERDAVRWGFIVFTLCGRLTQCWRLPAGWTPRAARE